jgi:hypothetical protein
MQISTSQRWVSLSPKRPNHRRRMKLRLLLGTMLDGFRAKPTEGAPIYVDAMVWTLLEPESGQPFCAPSVVAGIREAWATKTFPPSVHEFLELCRKHQQRIEFIQHRLEWICNAGHAAIEVLWKLAPEKLPKLREWSDEELDEVFERG